MAHADSRRARAKDRSSESPDIRVVTPIRRPVYPTRAGGRPIYCHSIRLSGDRSLYQEPIKPELCVPQGFIRDDGQGHFQAEESYRVSDSPGAIYTLATAVEGERNFNPTEPLLEATARSTVAGLLGNGYGRKIQAIGPKGASIGARPAVLGGINTLEGTPGYSLYAGARGWDHSQVLPFVSLNMRSFDRETAPDDLKVNPPAFEQSMKRFELTLGSLRTRKAE